MRNLPIHAKTTQAQRPVILSRFFKGAWGGGRLALVLSLCEGGVEINFCLMRGGIWLSFGVYFTHFPTPSPPLPGNYCTVPKAQPNRTVNMVYKRDCPIPGCGAKYLVTLANLFAYVHQLDYLYITAKREFQQAKLQPKGKVVVYESKADNSRKIMVLLLAMQYRHKKRCTNCQDRKEMKRLLKQKLKEQLQRTSQTTRNKGSRTVGWGYRDLRSIGKWCSQGRIIYWEHT